MKQLMRQSRSRGNATLISLIILAASLTTTLGMTVIVGEEVRNVAALPESERAYYKAESYIEQGLLEKKLNSNYQINKGVFDDPAPAGIANPYVCVTAPCFSTQPLAQTAHLIDFFATSQAQTGSQVVFEQDKTVQYDIDTSQAVGTAGTLEVRFGAPGGSFRGLEVTIAAYPKLSGPNAYSSVPGGPAVTPVFVDKKLVPSSQDIRLGTSAGLNGVGEAYPPLSSTYNYRLRFKALGASVTASTPIVVPAGGPATLPLLSADFRVRAVAQDGTSRRGIEVVVPASDQIAGVFDYVIFSDQNLDKTQAKYPTLPGNIAGTVRSVANGSCGDPLAPTVGVLANAPITVTPDNTTATTNASGTYAMSVTAGSKTVSIGALPGGYVACSPTSYSVNVTSLGTTTVDFRVEAPDVRGSISGTVASYNGPVCGGMTTPESATVTLTPGGATTTTGAGGSYQFTLLNPGAYSVGITLPAGAIACGANPQPLTVNPSANTTANIRFRYAPGSIQVDIWNFGGNCTNPFSHNSNRPFVFIDGSPQGRIAASGTGIYSATAGSHTVNITSSGAGSTTPAGWGPGCGASKSVVVPGGGFATVGFWMF